MKKDNTAQFNLSLNFDTPVTEFKANIERILPDVTDVAFTEEQRQEICISLLESNIRVLNKNVTKITFRPGNKISTSPDYSEPNDKSEALEGEAAVLRDELKRWLKLDNKSRKLSFADVIQGVDSIDRFESATKISVNKYSSLVLDTCIQNTEFTVPMTQDDLPLQESISFATLPSEIKPRLCGFLASSPRFCRLAILELLSDWKISEKTPESKELLNKCLVTMADEITHILSINNDQGLYKKYLIAVSNFHRGTVKTMAILDKIAPFWRLPEVKITGSIIPLLMQSVEKTKKVIDNYAPTYFDTNSFTVKDRICLRDECRKFTVNALYFPLQDRDLYYMYKLVDYVPEHDEPDYDEEKGAPIAVVSFGNQVYVVKILPGTDIDVFVEPRKSPSVSLVAQQILDTVAGEGVTMESIAMGNESTLRWRITMSTEIPRTARTKSEMNSYIRKYMNFHPIEIYHCEKKTIFTHHVAMTRAYLEAKKFEGGIVPRFVCCPTQILSILNYICPNYYRVDAEKTRISHVVVCYNMRGFSVPDYVRKYFSVSTFIQNTRVQLPIGYITQERDELFIFEN